MLFIGSCAGTFYALDKTSGQVKWTYNIRKDGDQNNFHGNPLITGDLIITGTDGGSRPTGVGSIYAFEKTTGKVRWKYDAGRRGVDTGILRLGNKVYATTLTDELICLDLQTGRLNWSFHSGAANDQMNGTVTPVGEANRVFFGGQNGKVYALDSRSGKIVWEKDLGYPISSFSLALSHGALYLGTAGKRIYRLDAKNGQVIAQFATGAELYRVVLAHNALVAVGAKTLACLPRSLEKPRWIHESVTSWSSAQPYIWRETSIVGTVDGQVTAHRLSDGSQDWSYKFTTGAIGGIGGDQNVLYIGTRQGTLFAYLLK